MIKKDIELIIVDDHPIFLDGLSVLLNEIEGIHVRGTFTNGHEALSFLSNNKINVVITDIDMPEMDGIELSRKIKSKYKACKIIALTMHNDSHIIAKLLEVGAEGYILKNTGKKELMMAIETVMTGETYFSEEVKMIYIESKVKGKKTENNYIKYKLSKRELEIVKLISEELTTVEIAERLFISDSTVETHRRNILSKLNVRNTAGLIKLAIQNKLIE